MIKESDNNVKLIVLDRLDSTSEAWSCPRRVDYGCSSGLIQVRTYLHFISIVSDQQYSADMEVRRKATSIVLSMTSSRFVEEAAVFLKKQLQKTQEADFEKVSAFYLIRGLRCDAQAFLLHLGS